MPTTPPQNPLDQLAADILTTAVEGGSGYWSCVSDIERAEDLTVISVKVHEEADADEPAIQGHQQFGIYGSLPSGDYKVEGVAVTYVDMIAAMKRIAASEVDQISREIAFERMLVSPEDADYDADDADVVLQVAVLGEVVYG